MTTDFEETIDELDASIFSGYALYDASKRARLKANCERWLRAIADHESTEDGAADEALARGRSTP